MIGTIKKVGRGMWQFASFLFWPQLKYKKVRCKKMKDNTIFDLQQSRKDSEFVASNAELELEVGADIIETAADLNHYGDDHQSSGHLYLVRLLGKDAEYRNEVIRKMAERGIACNVHYKPLPMMTAYKNLGFDIKDYPNAYRQFENEVTLPLHTRLSNEDVEYVIGNFVDIISKYY